MAWPIVKPLCSLSARHKDGKEYPASFALNFNYVLFTWKVRCLCLANYAFLSDYLKWHHIKGESLLAIALSATRKSRSIRMPLWHTNHPWSPVVNLGPITVSLSNLSHRIKWSEIMRDDRRDKRSSYSTPLAKKKSKDGSSPRQTVSHLA